MPVVQPTLEDLGTALREVTFVVVDLETTGGSAHESAITEIGAVKARGGEELGRFQTCLLYTSDAADARSSVDFGGRRIIKKKNTTKNTQKN